MSLTKISLLSYLKQEQIINDYWHDCLRYELDKNIYYYGNHFKRSREFVQNSKIEKLKYAFKLFSLKIEGKLRKKIIDKSKPVIISNAYFNFNDELAKIGFIVIQPPWTNDRSYWGYYDAELIDMCIKIRSIFEFSDFNHFLSKEFIELLEKFAGLFKSFISKQQIAALVVPNDESFFENLSIKIFKELKLSTFIFLHGLTVNYNGIDEHRSDYLIVWGKKLKELYVKSGMEEKKIFISGHPKYQLRIKEPIQFSLNNILVITKAIPGSPHSDGVIFSDRGNLIVYLLSIQKILQKCNVERVRLRPHPSESMDWYMKFLDKDFFIPDTDHLPASLAKTSLIIGPVSSVFLDAISSKVNYLVYEPKIGDKNILNRKLNPPYDGSDVRVPVAYDEETLLKFLKEKKCADADFLNDYLQTPFDVSFMKELIK